MIQTIYDKFPELNKISKDNFSGFLLDMENLYKFLLNRPDSLKVIQGYHYAGFIQWNQENAEIIRKAHSCSDLEIKRGKFDRDTKFLGILKESVEFLLKGFQNMASKGQSQHH